MSTTTRPRLSQVDFGKATVFMQQNRDYFLSKRPTREAAAKYLSEQMKITVPISSINALRESSGVQWKVRHATHSPPQHGPKYRVLVEAVHSLYHKLGEKPPEKLEQLFVSQTQGK